MEMGYEACLVHMGDSILLTLLFKTILNASLLWFQPILILGIF